MGVPLKQMGLLCAVAITLLSVVRFFHHHEVVRMHSNQSFQPPPAPRPPRAARVAEHHGEPPPPPPVEYVSYFDDVDYDGAPPSPNAGTVRRAAGASTPRGATKASSPSSNAEARHSPHTRYQHGLKHHPRPQPGSRPAEPSSKPSKLPSSTGHTAASTRSTTAVDDKQHKQMKSSLREWLPPENPPDSMDTGGNAEEEEADGVEEDVLGDALDDELVAKVYDGIAPPHQGLGLSITDFIGTLFTGHRSDSQSSHSFMDGMRSAMHMPKREEGTREAAGAKGNTNSVWQTIPENHESNPAVKRLLAKRPPHSGPWMKLTWPPSSAKPPIHMHLNYRQFVEEGHLPDPRRSKGINSHAWVSYLASTSNGKMLHKYRFANKLLPLLPQEDVKWHFDRCAVVLNSGELLASSYGDEIDAHDAVIRVNYPPIEGFTRHVGSKTTFDFTNHHNAQELLNPASDRFIPLDQGTRSVQPFSSVKSTLVLFETPNSEGWRLNFLPEISMRFPSSLAILSPDFMVAAEEVWRNVSGEVAQKGEVCLAMKRRFERAEDSLAASSRRKFSRGIGAHSFSLRTGLEQACKPTSGWFALLFAYQACDQVSAYGFSSWKKQREGVQQAPYHYFDQVQGVTNVHSFDLSNRVYRRLAQTYDITLK